MDSIISRQLAGVGADGPLGAGERLFGWRAALAENERIAQRVGTQDASIRDTLSSVGATGEVTPCVMPGSGLAARIAQTALPWVLAALTVWAIACLATGGQPHLLLQRLRW